MTFKSDFITGLKEEVTVLNKLKIVDPTIYQTNSTAIVDFISDKYIYELKKRNCKKTTYPTTIIGYNKLLYADKQDKPFILLFSFTDGLYYCVYNSDLKYNVKKFVRHSRSDYIDKRSDYVFIDVDQLKPFSTFENQFNSPRPTVQI